MTKVFPCLIDSEPIHVIAYNCEQINGNENQNVNIVNLSLYVFANAQHLSLMSCLIEVLKQTWFNVIHDIQVNMSLWATYKHFQMHMYFGMHCI